MIKLQLCLGSRRLPPLLSLVGLFPFSWRAQRYGFIISYISDGLRPSLDRMITFTLQQLRSRHRLCGLRL
jgi:hypothetical protein